jgi:hypothetical protein
MTTWEAECEASRTEALSGREANVERVLINEPMHTQRRPAARTTCARSVQIIGTERRKWNKAMATLHSRG